MTKIIDALAIAGLVERARLARRRRANLNLHGANADPIQRFLNAAEPDTYARPHRHAPSRWELFLVLRGAADYLIFDDTGRVTERLSLAANGSLVEIPGACWHSVAVRRPGTLLFEVKPGPYDPRTDKEFAAWAPPEGHATAAGYQAWLAMAKVADRWSGAAGRDAPR
jgi:cupin fold WbuC family metalloprotein